MNDTPAFIKYESKTRAFKIISVVIMLLSLACVLTFGILEIVMSDSGPFFYEISAGIVCDAASLLLFFTADKRRAVIGRYNAYKKVLMRNPHNSVAEISEVCGVEPKVVVTDFDMMVKLGFFEGLTVDFEGQKVDLFTGKEKQIFVCPICGGQNEIESGGELKCEFCGAIKEKEE